MCAWNDPPKGKLIDFSNILNNKSDLNLPYLPPISHETDKSKPPIIIFDNKIEIFNGTNYETELYELLGVSTFDESKSLTEEKFCDIVKLVSEKKFFSQIEKRLNQSSDLLRTNSLTKEAAIVFMRLIYHIHCKNYNEADSVINELAADYTVEVSSWLIAYRKLLTELKSL